MRRPLLIATSALLSLTLASALVACSSDDEAPSTPANDAGNGSDTGSGDAGTADSGGGTDAGAQDAGNDTGTPSTPVRCTQAQFDQTADATIGGDYSATTPPDVVFPTTSSIAQYTPRCLKVKKGATLNFKGKFSFHPLEAEGGDTPSPIPTQSVDRPDNTLAVTFDTEGTFGFQCVFHASNMFGAVQVVP